MAYTIHDTDGNGYEIPDNATLPNRFILGAAPATIRPALHQYEPIRSARWPYVLSFVIGAVVGWLI